MFERFTRRHTKTDDEPANPQRRAVTFGGIAAGAVAVGLVSRGEVEQGVSDSPVPKETPTILDKPIEDVAGEEMSVEAVYPKSESTYFYAERDKYRAQYELELQQMPSVEEFVSLLREHFDISAIPDKTLRQEVTDNIIGLPFVESRYDETRVSEEGAFGIVQIMLKTWKDLAKPDEDPTDVVDQIKVASRYFVQSYLHLHDTCRNELDIITIIYFDGDEQSMNKYFLAPVLIGCYNSGMGNLEKIIKSFIQLFPSVYEGLALTGDNDIPTGYDVYDGMTKAAMLDGWRPRYKIHGSEYTAKVYGATAAMSPVA